MENEPRAYAEDMNYWSTTVHPSVSQGEISQLLEEFGATSVMVMTGQAGGRYAWLIRFQWQGRSYRFAFSPLPCRFPQRAYTFSGKRRTAEEQSRYQMGRIALGLVKAILTAARATPAALFGFLELPGVRSESGLPATAAEVDVDGLTAALPEITIKPMLLGDGE
jgi:hypothetical protein